MTVQELIDALQKIEDKSLEVVYDYDATLQPVEEIRIVRDITWRDSEEKDRVEIA